MCPEGKEWGKKDAWQRIEAYQTNSGVAEGETRCGNASAGLRRAINRSNLIAKSGSHGKMPKTSPIDRYKEVVGFFHKQ